MLRTRGEARRTPADWRRTSSRCPPFHLRQAANVLAVILEDVVGHEHDRDRARELRDLLLASDSLLQGREGQGALVAKSEDLAVEDGAIRQPARGRDDLGESMRDELFTAGPEVQHATALDELGADAVPLPLDQPVVRVSERVDRTFEGRREEERVRARAIVVCTFVGEECRVPLR